MCCNFFLPLRIQYLHNKNNCTQCKLYHSQCKCKSILQHISHFPIKPFTFFIMKLNLPKIVSNCLIFKTFSSPQINQPSKTTSHKLQLRCILHIYSLSIPKIIAWFMTTRYNNNSSYCHESFYIPVFPLQKWWSNWMMLFRALYYTNPLILNPTKVYLTCKADTRFTYSWIHVNIWKLQNKIPQYEGMTRLHSQKKHNH